MGAVLKSVGTLDTRVLLAAAVGLDRGLNYATTIAQQQFMRGPKGLHVRRISGRLAGGMAHKVTVVPGRGVVGKFGNAVRYAAYHEFGFHGTEHVRAHDRLLKVMGKSGLGVELRRAVRTDQREHLGFKRSGIWEWRHLAPKRQAALFATIQHVKAHDRRVDYPGMPFAWPALKKAEPLILRAVKEEIRKVTP
jgi:hypothetical protein